MRKISLLSVLIFIYVHAFTQSGDTARDQVLARYTLAKMTKQIGTNSTDTRLLITHDSPHQGANVPLGFQHFLYDFGEVRIVRKIKNVSDELKQFYLLNQQPATQQLLIARVTDANGTVAYNTFLAGAYRTMITFTSAPPYREIATSQGSQCAQWTMQPGTVLAAQSGNVATANWLFGGYLFKNKYKLTMQINALPQYGTSAQISYVKMERNIRLFYGLVGTGWTTTYGPKARTSPSNLIPWECVPGGTQSASGRSGGSFSNYSVTPDPFSHSHTFLGNTWRWFFYIAFYVNTYLDIPFQQDIFTHVPITSSLDVQNVTINTFSQPFIFPITGANGSRFQTYIAQQLFAGVANNVSTALYNLNHTDFSARNSNWLWNEMENVSPNTLNCTTECSSANYSITGTEPICTSSNYSLTPVTNGTITWSVNPLNSVSFNPVNGFQTTITKSPSYNGMVTLTATLNSVCGNIAIPKPVRVGVYSSSDYPIKEPAGSRCINNPAFFSTNQLPDAINYNWTWPSGWTKLSGGGYSIILRVGTTSGNVGVNVTNACGAGIGTATKFITASNCGFAFTASPNPTTDDVTINTVQPEESYATDASQTKIYQIKVIDQSGNVKKQHNYPSGVASINISLNNLLSGIYIIQAYNGSVWSSQQIVKQ